VIGSWAAFEILGADRAAATRALGGASTRISMVGDSLTSGSLPFQPDAFAEARWSHSTIDAYVSRGVRTKLKADRYTGLTAVDAIRDKSGDSDAWVIALGTNDAVIYSNERQAEVIRGMMDHIGTGHRVMWINVYLPDSRPLQLAWNETLDDAAADRSDMFVYDWASFAAENQRWLARDRIHYSSDGYRSRATAIGLASRQLLPGDSQSLVPPSWRLPRSKP
jgi:lysophospholipase L1-like esterase